MKFQEKVKEYNSLEPDERNGLIGQICQDPLIFSDIFFNISSYFQNDLLSFAVENLELAVVENKIFGWLYGEEIFSAILFPNEKIILNIKDIKFKIEEVSDTNLNSVIRKINSFLGKEQVGNLTTDGFFTSTDYLFYQVKISESIDELLDIENSLTEVKLSIYSEGLFIKYEILPKENIVDSKNTLIQRAISTFIAVGIMKNSLFGKIKNYQLDEVEGKTAKFFITTLGNERIAGNVSVIGGGWIGNIGDLKEKMEPEDHQLIDSDLDTMKKIAKKVALFDENSNMIEYISAAHQFKNKLNELYNLSKEGKLSKVTRKKIKTMHYHLDSGTEDAEHWIKVMIKTSPLSKKVTKD